MTLLAVPAKILVTILVFLLIAGAIIVILFFVVRAKVVANTETKYPRADEQPKDDQPRT